MHHNWKHIFKIIGMTLAVLALGLLLLFSYFNLPGPAPREDVRLGITYSARYATDLGLDWRETYLALLDDIKVKELRLPVYWDLVEKDKGQYDFADLDWQLSEAEKHQTSVILVIGQRVPRWPECHIPSWVTTDDQRKGELLRFMGKTIERYRHNTAVMTWQVENEPFLSFGNCPTFDKDFFDQEIAFVHAADATRPILTTDSGELSLWFQAASRGDMFGTTLYRHLWNSRFGYFTYPIGPNFFRAKAWLSRVLAQQKNFMVIELQAEPWASGWVANVSLEEQFRTMDEKKLIENVDYAERVGFPDIYLWGGEWWYFLKTKKDYPAVWDTARELFRNHEINAQ